MARPTLASATVAPDSGWASNPDRHCAPERKIDPDLFFPAGHSHYAVEPALRACQYCPVRAPCADYALANPGLHGVWGGLTQAERDRRHHLLRYEDDL